MHRCNRFIDDCISISCHEIKTPILLDVMEVNPIEIDCRNMDVRVILSCSIICFTNTSAFLKVSPDYVWLTPDILSSGEFDIISNTDWIII